MNGHQVVAVGGVGAGVLLLAWLLKRHGETVNGGGQDVQSSSIPEMLGSGGGGAGAAFAPVEYSFPAAELASLSDEGGGFGPAPNMGYNQPSNQTSDLLSAFNKAVGGAGGGCGCGCSNEKAAYSAPSSPPPVPIQSYQPPPFNYSGAATPAAYQPTNADRSAYLMYSGHPENIASDLSRWGSKSFAAQGPVGTMLAGISKTAGATFDSMRALWG